MGIVVPIITDFNGSGINKATKAFGQLETTGQKAGFAVRKAAVPAGIALVALGAAAIDFGKAAVEDAAASDLLAGQLKRVTGATDAGVAAADKYITALSMQVGIADDQLRPALGKLATATGDVGKAQDLLAIALDVSAQTGKPLEAVTSSLAKAYGGNLGALKKLLPGFDEGIIKSKDFKKAQAELARLTGGAAAEAAETGAGKFRTLGVTLDETKEAIGAALMPIISAALPLLQKFAEFAQDNSTLLVILAGVIGGVAVAIGLANVAMTILALNPVVLTIIAITAGIALLTAGFILAYQKSDTFRAIIDKIGDVFRAVFGWIRDNSGPILGALRVAFGLLLAPIKFVFKALEKVIDAIKWIADHLPDIEGTGTVPDILKPGGVARAGAIPKLAHGGIVTAATLALIGEDGPEAVIPLSRGRRAMGAAGGVGGMGGITINVQAGLVSTPDQIGQQIIEAIQQAQRRSGPVFRAA